MMPNQNSGVRKWTPEQEDNAGVDVTSLIGIEDLRRGVITQCRWIHGEAGADARYCGRPVKPGTSWCRSIIVESSSARRTSD